MQKVHHPAPKRQGVGILFLLGNVGCNPLAWVPGSTSSVEESDIGCRVTLTDHSSLFQVEMELSCEGEGTDCFVIEQLTCGGEDRSDALPIDLREAPNASPGAGYCVEECSPAVAGGMLWDTPSLLELDGCNVHDET